MKRPTRPGNITPRQKCIYIIGLGLIVLEVSMVPILNELFFASSPLWYNELQLALNETPALSKIVMSEWLIICLICFAIGVWTAVVIRSYMKGQTENSDKRLRHSANTVLMLSANTLLFSVYLIAIQVLLKSTIKEFEENVPILPAGCWKSFLLWFPLVVSTVISPLILIRRNKISVKGTFSRSIDSHSNPT